MIQTKRIERDWILVTYDVKADDTLRDMIRHKLLKHMGAIYQNDSVYLVPKKIHNADEIKKWGKDNFNINLIVFGLDATLDDCKTLSKRYVADLRNRKRDVNEQSQRVWERLIEIEENIDDPDISRLTGIHKMIEGITGQYDELRKLINRYGNKTDEFKLERLFAIVEKCSKRYDRIKEMKKKRIDQGYV